MAARFRTAARAYLVVPRPSCARTFASLVFFFFLNEKHINMLFRPSPDSPPLFYGRCAQSSSACGNAARRLGLKSGLLPTEPNGAQSAFPETAISRSRLHAPLRKRRVRRARGRATRGSSSTRRAAKFRSGLLARCSKSACSRERKRERTPEGQEGPDLKRGR